jgi:hypothetical protein
VREPPGLEGLATPGGRDRKPQNGVFREPDHIVGDELVHWDWKEVFRMDCSDDAHINLKELRAVKAYLRRRAKKGPVGPGERVIILCDSRVVVGALGHGRSPSSPLNRMLRQMLPIVIGSHLYPIVLWVPTGANPSDPPSRGASLHVWLASCRTAAAQRSRVRDSLLQSS